MCVGDVEEGYLKAVLECMEVVQPFYKVFGKHISRISGGCWCWLGRRIIWAVTLGCRGDLKREFLYF